MRTRQQLRSIFGPTFGDKTLVANDVDFGDAASLTYSVESVTGVGAQQDGVFTFNANSREFTLALA